jgi:hypothetical protein
VGVPRGQECGRRCPPAAGGDARLGFKGGAWRRQSPGRDDTYILLSSPPLFRAPRRITPCRHPPWWILSLMATTRRESGRWCVEHLIRQSPAVVPASPHTHHIVYGFVSYSPAGSRRTLRHCPQPFLNGFSKGAAARHQSRRHEERSCLGSYRAAVFLASLSLAKKSANNHSTTFSIHNLCQRRCSER